MFYSGVFIDNFVHISYLALVFLWLVLSRGMMAGVPAGIVLDKWVPISLRFWKNKRDKKIQSLPPANIHLFTVKRRSTRKRCEICSKLAIKTPEPLLILSMSLFTGSFFEKKELLQNLSASNTYQLIRPKMFTR